MFQRIWKVKSKIPFARFVSSNADRIKQKVDKIPMIKDFQSTKTKKEHHGVFIETYGCIMNTNDTEIVQSILHKKGYTFAPSPEEASVIMLNTCSIRESAELKIQHRIRQLHAFPQKPVIGILGCMAERVKEAFFEEPYKVDFVCGPDAYRSIPRLVETARANRPMEDKINTLLSLDETYADIEPLVLEPNRPRAYLSISRGCNNMCTYCIVPFTRGRERSRPMDSLLTSVDQLKEQGIREIVFLGQNVNTYNDTSVQRGTMEQAPGFSTVYKPPLKGWVFEDLLREASSLAPHVRFRFTSPHPKDFTLSLVQLMAERKNICNHLHMPAQSGSTDVLSTMGRGYSREAYLDLVDAVRSILPSCSLSTDMMVGFCGEKESDFQDTLSLMRLVDYDQAYMFAYSMREKTRAHRRWKDDVPQEVKLDRLERLIDLYHLGAKERRKRDHGKTFEVLVEGLAPRKNGMMSRTDGNQVVILPLDTVGLVPGEYVQVEITDSTSATLFGKVVGKIDGEA